MGLFDKIFKKKETSNTPKGFHAVNIKDIIKHGQDTVQVTLDIPKELKSQFNFIPGQYIDFSIEINGEELRRSYSICSALNEDISVAIKQVENGKVSTWFNEKATVGSSIYAASPKGSFTIPSNAKNITAIAAGSGITPILSMTKNLTSSQKMELIYGNKTLDSTLFKSSIEAISNVKPNYFLSQEEKEGNVFGRISTETLTAFIKTNLDILKSDGFFICGPEEMIQSANEVLKSFGVAKDKIHFELFTTPVLLKDDSQDKTNNFSGNSKVTVILDDEKLEFDLDSNGKNILDIVNGKGMDAPYSCKGGVCCSCRAKVIKGSATMDLNYALTEGEVADGYILTCQAHPSSDELVISYDD